MDTGHVSFLFPTFIAKVEAKAVVVEVGHCQVVGFLREQWGPSTPSCAKDKHISIHFNTFPRFSLVFL